MRLICYYVLPLIFLSILLYLHRPHNYETQFIRRNKGTTIVTAYFEISSKYPSHKYFKWIKNFLLIKDPIVIITSASLKEFMLKNRPKNYKTLIVIRNESNFMVRKRYGDKFWKHQHDIDIEKKIHKGEYLYWIWDEKSEWLKQVALLNPFSSKTFVWMDMGAFRNTKYNNKKVIQTDFTKNSLLNDRMIFLRISTAVKWLQSKYMSRHIYKDVIQYNMYLGGGIFGGTKDAIFKWHNKFYNEMDLWAKEKKFIGKDQSMMISCCHKNPELCAYVDPNHDYGDPFFYMQPWFHGETNNKVYIPGFNIYK